MKYTDEEPKNMTINLDGLEDIEIQPDIIEDESSSTSNHNVTINNTGSILKYDTSDKPEYHEISKTEPMMSDSDMRLSIEDMKSNGFDKNSPIRMYEGLILDGRNRTVAAKYAGVKVVTVEFTGTYAEAEAESIRLNNRRRHKSSGQKAMTAAYTLKANKHRRRIIETELLLDNPKIARSTLSQKITQKCAIIQISTVARQQGVSKRNVVNATKLLENDEELAERVFTGELSLTKAQAIYIEIQTIRNKKYGKDGDFTPEEVAHYKKTEAVKRDPEGAVAKMEMKGVIIQRLKKENKKLKDDVHNLKEENQMLKESIQNLHDVMKAIVDIIPKDKATVAKLKSLNF